MWEEEGVRCVVEDPGVCQTCEVGVGNGQWVSLGVGDITVDSAADESCWPEDVGGAFDLKPSKMNIKLIAANGQAMRHSGEKEITFRDPDSKDVMSMKLQVTEVRKALAAVHRLTEKGCFVQFGPEEADNFIQYGKNGKKVKLIKKGRSYIMRVEFVKWIPDSPFRGQAM